MKPKLSRKGMALLKKALGVIQRHPSKFDMGDWIHHDEKARGRAPYCGTVACLAGHIVLASGVKRAGYSYTRQDFPQEWRRRMPEAVGIRDAAETMLDISRDAGGKLFLTSHWPDSFYVAYHGGSPRTRVKILAARVQHWLKTGE